MGGTVCRRRMVGPQPAPRPLRGGHGGSPPVRALGRLGSHRSATGPPYAAPPGAGRAGVLLALVLLWAGGAFAQATRGERLLDRLRSDDTVRVVVFGDSLTAGWSAWNPAQEGFPQVLGQLLQAQFPRCHIELLPIGVPGQTSGEALGLFDGAVIGRAPDLLVIQLGGNDKGKGRSPTGLRDNLTRMVRIAKSSTEAAVILCTPPIVTDLGGEAYLRAVRSVATGMDVALADLDATLLRWDHDDRGIFPWGQHPGSDVHAVIAGEVHRALCAILGLPPAPAVTIGERCEFVEPGRPVDVQIAVSNDLDAAATGELSVWVGDGCTETTVEVPAQSEISVPVAVTVPPRLPGDRSFRRRLLATLRSGDSLSTDCAWATLAPAALAERVDHYDPLAPPPTPGGWRTSLSGDSLVIGPQAWGGPWDLSARFGLFCDGSALIVQADVTDDRVVVDEPTSPTEGDLVEVWIDPRPASTQGRAAHNGGVFGLFVTPNRFDAPEAQWQTLDPGPPGLAGTRARSSRTRSGYYAIARIPLAALGCTQPEDMELRGFDFALDDCDNRGRDSQAMWAGGKDTYIDASLCAGLTMDPNRAGQFRLCVR